MSTLNTNPNPDPARTPDPGPRPPRQTSSRPEELRRFAPLADHAGKPIYLAGMLLYFGSGLLVAVSVMVDAWWGGSWRLWSWWHWPVYVVGGLFFLAVMLQCVRMFFRYRRGVERG